MRHDPELSAAVASLEDRHSCGKQVNAGLNERYPTSKASEVDPNGEFERAYAEVAGTVTERI